MGLDLGRDCPDLDRIASDLDWVILNLGCKGVGPGLELGGSGLDWF